MSDAGRRRFLEQLMGATTVAAWRPVKLPRLGSAEPGDETYWEEIKSRFALPPGQIPMNSANMAPAPRSVDDAVVRAVRDIDADVSYQNRGKYDVLRDTTRERVARLLGVATDEIALVRNASEANNIVVGGLSLGAGDEVVIIDHNHPTNNVAWDVRAKRYGFAVNRLSLPVQPSSGQEIVDLVSRVFTPRTKVLSFTDITNSTGLRMPTAELAQVARARGIYVHVDGAQTCGVLERNLRTLGCDSYSASGQKWLMGPREIGILYVRAARVAELWPGVVGVGWGNDADTVALGARKFETMGQRNDATMAGLAAALDFSEQVGLARIEARVGELANRLYAGLVEAGFAIVTPKPNELRHGVIVVKAEAAVAQRWHQRLYAGYSVISSPTGGLRLSPTISATLTDVDRAVKALVAVRAEPV